MALSVKKIGIGVCFALIAAGASGCSGMSKMNPFGGAAGAKSGASAQQAAVDGRWIGSGAVSTFNNGVFETRAADTGEKMAEGNYTFGSGSQGNVIAIEVRSLVRGTVSHVNCAPAKGKLYCTSQDNKQFILTRG